MKTLKKKKLKLSKVTILKLNELNKIAGGKIKDTTDCGGGGGGSAHAFNTCM